MKNLLSCLLFTIITIFILPYHVHGEGGSIDTLKFCNENKERKKEIFFYEHSRIKIGFEQRIKELDSYRELSYEEYCMLHFPFYVTINKMRNNLKEYTSIDVKTKIFLDQ